MILHDFLSYKELKLPSFGNHFEKGKMQDYIQPGQISKSQDVISLTHISGELFQKKREQNIPDTRCQVLRAKIWSVPENYVDANKTHAYHISLGEKENV